MVIIQSLLLYMFVAFYIQIQQYNMQSINNTLLNQALISKSLRQKNIQQENVSDCNFSFILVVNVDLGESDVMVAGPFKAKSPGVEGSALERIRVSLTEEITSERKRLVLESQNELLKLLKSKPNANAPRENEKAQETSLGISILHLDLLKKTTSKNDLNTICKKWVG